MSAKRMPFSIPMIILGALKASLAYADFEVAQDGACPKLVDQGTPECHSNMNIAEVTDEIPDHGIPEGSAIYVIKPADNSGLKFSYDGGDNGKINIFINFVHSDDVKASSVCEFFLGSHSKSFSYNQIRNTLKVFSGDAKKKWIPASYDSMGRRVKNEAGIPIPGGYYEEEPTKNYVLNLDQYVEFLKGKSLKEIVPGYHPNNNTNKTVLSRVVCRTLSNEEMAIVLEKERIEAERIEKERLAELERQRIEQEKIEKERLRLEKLERERKERERLAKIKAENAKISSNIADLENISRSIDANLAEVNRALEAEETIKKQAAQEMQDFMTNVYEKSHCGCREGKLKDQQEKKQKVDRESDARIAQFQKSRASLLESKKKAQRNIEDMKEKLQ